MKSLSVALSLLALSALPAAAAELAQNQPAPQPAAPAETGTPQRALSPADVQFLQQASIGGRAEVEMGRLAMQKAQEPAVRVFGRWMVTDHGMINDTLARIAEHYGVTLSGGLDQRHETELRQLQRLTGMAFDQRYMISTVQAHQQSVAAFQQETQNGGNRLLKAVAANAIPMLEQHLAAAQELKQLPALASGTRRQPMTGAGSSAPGTR